MRPYYQDEFVTIWHGDCRPYLPELRASAVVTDPPYGVSKNTGRRLHATKGGGFVGGNIQAKAKDYGATHWDDEPLDADTWKILRRLSREQIVWGANHLQAVLGKPPRTLVWDKKLKNDWNDDFSDCEFAWCSIVGPDRMYRHRWVGMLREGNEPRYHPTQKPLALMRWCIELLPKDYDVLDPFMGSGTTLVAAKGLGRHAVGFEVEERWCEVAAKRLSQETLGLSA